MTPRRSLPLAEALDLKYEITCVARSGRGLPRASPGGTREEKETSRLRVEKAAAVRMDAVADRAAKSSPASTSGRSEPAAARTTPPKKDLTPGLNPLLPVRYIETIVGSQRQYVLFYRPRRGSVVAGADGVESKEPAAQGQSTETTVGPRTLSREP